MREHLVPDREVRVDKVVDDGLVWWETVYRDWVITAWPTGPYVWSLRRESRDGEEVVAEGDALTHEEASTELLDAVREQDNLSTADFEWYHAAEEYEVEGEVGGATAGDGTEYNAEVVSSAYGYDVMSEDDEHIESDETYDSPEQAISAAMERVDELPRPGQQSLEDMPGFESSREFKRGYFHGYKDAVQDHDDEITISQGRYIRIEPLTTREGNKWRWAEYIWGPNDEEPMRGPDGRQRQGGPFDTEEEARQAAEAEARRLTGRWGKIAALEWDERRYDSPVGEVDDIKWWARVPGQEWMAAVEYLHPDIYTVEEETYYWKVEDENTGRVLAEGNTDSEQWSKRAVEEWVAEQGGQLFAKASRSKVSLTSDDTDWRVEDGEIFIYETDAEGWEGYVVEPAGDGTWWAYFFDRVDPDGGHSSTIDYFDNPVDAIRHVNIEYLGYFEEESEDQIPDIAREHS